MRIPKQPSLLAALLLPALLTSCTSKDSTRSSAQTAAIPDTLCFQQVVGRDSTTLTLVLNDSLVTGFLSLRPYEKDQAQGSLSGTRSGETITADWQRSGEGVTQTHALNLTLSGDTLRWREGERVEQDGKWVLKTPSAGFEYVLPKTDCARP
ncbi:MAG: hypothetical protein H7Z72_06630 [Bacteroidetes bacterium]|nr:hypothetical protein [Fibrella sp.]